MKRLAKILGVAMCGVTILSSVACGGKVIDSIRSDREQIYVNVYNGGVGTEWFNNLKNEWNAANEKYEIIPDMQKKETSDIKAEIEAGVSSKSTSPLCYFSISSNLKSIINMDGFLDISDMFDKKPDGDGGMTVKEKLAEYYDDWMGVASSD